MVTRRCARLGLLKSMRPVSRSAQLARAGAALADAAPAPHPRPLDRRTVRTVRAHRDLRDLRDLRDQRPCELRPLTEWRTRRYHWLMDPSPALPGSGRRGTHDGSSVIIFSRTFAAPIDDVWAACTEPERMRQWIGTWTGDPRSGEVAFRMTAEGDDAPEEVYLVESCEPPRRCVLRSRDGTSFSADGTGPLVTWHHTLELRETAGSTLLTFMQVVPDGQVGADLVASVGPGWDYYLDRLVALSRGADPSRVEFEPYLGRSDHYRGLFT